MDKDRSPNHGGSLLPPSSRRNSGYSSSGNTKPEAPPSPGLPPLAPGSSSESGFGHGMSTTDGGHRSSCDIISRMPDNPPKTLGHRRAHSEIITLPDDINFDCDFGLVGGFDGPSSFSDDTDEDLLAMYLDLDKFNSSSSATSALQVGESSSSGAAAAAAASLVTSQIPAENVFPEAATGQKTRVRRHQHSLSMDGSMEIKPELLMSGMDEEFTVDAKRTMSASKLAELALIDPKRAKRIWANRQSAARSKERKTRYISELERKVQTLQTETTTLSAKFTILQRDTNGLNAENSELKLRLQAKQQQVHLQDALNEALKEEIQHLKVVTGQALAPNGGGGQMMMNFLPSSTFGGGGQQFYNNNNNLNAASFNNTQLAARQFQQLQIHSQKHHHLQFQQIQQQQLQQQQIQRDARMTQKQNANATKD